MEKRNLTCIGCPLGCSITVELEQGQVRSVTGNTCPNGDAYARKEVVNPTRILTTTVRVVGGTQPVVSVKTAADVPESKLMDCMRALKGLSVPAPVEMGQILVPDVAATGVAVIATQRAQRRK